MKLDALIECADESRKMPEMSWRMFGHFCGTQSRRH